MLKDFLSMFQKVLALVVIVHLAACATNFRQGLQNLEGHNYPEALRFFEADAKLGYRIPAIHAANLYIIDYQIPRDLEKSRYYLDMALKADYGRYDQVYDYYIPLVKAYQILADDQQPDKTEAFFILNYQKYQEYSWPLYVLGLCNLIGYGLDMNLDNAKTLFEKAHQKQISDHNNANYAWWLSVYPDASFRNPKKALSLILQIIDDDDLKDKPLFLDTVAAVYAINGEFDKALRYQKEAISVLNENISKYPYLSLYSDVFNDRFEFYNANEAWIFSMEDIKRCGYESKRCFKLN